MAQLLRFYGFQRIAAMLLGGGLMWLAVRILGSAPPEYWNEWPPKASLSLSNLVSGSLSVAFCGWAYLVLKPWLGREGWTGIAAGSAFSLTLIWGVSGTCHCLVGIYYLRNGERGCVPPVLGEWMRVVGWPLLIGSVPIVLLELHQMAIVNPDLRRWLFSGQGHAATWIRPVELKQMSKPLANAAGSSAGHVEEY